MTVICFGLFNSIVFTFPVNYYKQHTNSELQNSLPKCRYWSDDSLLYEQELLMAGALPLLQTTNHRSIPHQIGNTGTYFDTIYTSSGAMTLMNMSHNNHIYTCLPHPSNTKATFG